LPPLAQAKHHSTPESIEKTLERIEKDVQKNEKVSTTIESSHNKSTTENPTPPIMLPQPVLPTPSSENSRNSTSGDQANLPIVLPPPVAQPTPITPTPDFIKSLPSILTPGQPEQSNLGNSTNTNQQNAQTPSALPNLPLDQKAAKIDKILDSIQTKLEKSEEKTIKIEHKDQISNSKATTFVQSPSSPIPKLPNGYPLSVINTEEPKNESPVIQNQQAGLPINVIPPISQVSQNSQNLANIVLNTPFPLPVFPGVEVQRSGSEGSAVPKITVDLAKMTEGLAKNPEVANMANQVINKFGSEVTNIVTTEMQKQGPAAQQTSQNKSVDDDFLKRLFEKYAQGENYDDYLSSSKKSTDAKLSTLSTQNQSIQAPSNTTASSQTSASATENPSALPLIEKAAVPISGANSPLAPFDNKLQLPLIEQKNANATISGSNAGQLPMMPNLADLAKSFMVNMQQSDLNNTLATMLPDIKGLPKLDLRQQTPNNLNGSGKDFPANNPFANLALFAKDDKINLPFDLSKLPNQKIDVNDFLKNLPNIENLNKPLIRTPLNQNGTQSDAMLPPFDEFEDSDSAGKNNTVFDDGPLSSTNLSDNNTSLNLNDSSLAQNGTVHNASVSQANKTSIRKSKRGSKNNSTDVNLSKIQEQFKQLAKMESEPDQQVNGTQAKASSNITTTDIINEFKKVVEEKVGAIASKQSTQKPGVLPSGPPVTEIIQQMRGGSKSATTQQITNISSGNNPSASPSSITRVTVPPGVAVVKTSVVTPKIGLMPRFSGQGIRAQLNSPQTLDLMKSMARTDAKFADQIASIINDQTNKQISIPEKVGSTIQTKVLPVDRSDNQFGFIRIVGLSEFVNQKGVKENPLIQQAIQNKQYNMILNSVEY